MKEENKENKEKLVQNLDQAQKKLEEMTLDEFMQGRKLSGIAIMSQSQKVYRLINDIEETKKKEETDKE